MVSQWVGGEANFSAYCREQATLVGGDGLERLGVLRRNRRPHQSTGACSRTTDSSGRPEILTEILGVVERQVAAFRDR